MSDESERNLWYRLATGSDLDPNTRVFTVIVQRDRETGYCVGYVDGFPGAHSQAATQRELDANMREVIHMLLEDEPNKRPWIIETKVYEKGPNDG